jgi:glycine dehydrogenase
VVIVAADLADADPAQGSGEFGADVCVGSSQRFRRADGLRRPARRLHGLHGRLKRKMPGRLIGVSIDSRGKPGYRLSLQTREQHIRRDKATSNICTAQVLLAVMASMYAVYHGPEGLRHIAMEVHFARPPRSPPQGSAGGIASRTDRSSTPSSSGARQGHRADVMRPRFRKDINLRDSSTPITRHQSLDETTTMDDVRASANAFGAEFGNRDAPESWPERADARHRFPHPEVFNSYHSETEMLRYIKRLESKDLALNESMIALGSCTMKLNATSEMMPLSWPEVSSLHPFVPADQSAGYREMLGNLEDWLAESPGSPRSRCSRTPVRRANTPACSPSALPPRAARATANICLIPVSAHGTNPPRGDGRHEGGRREMR